MIPVQTPILTPEQLHAVAQRILDISSADTVSVSLSHVADGVTRIMNNRVRMDASGDELELTIKTQFGSRMSMQLATTQIDTESLRRAVQYLERVAHDLPGDPMATSMPDRPVKYGLSTAWHDETADAFIEARHATVSKLVAPLRDAGLTAVAYVGVHLRSIAHLERSGATYGGRESDSEIVATGWGPGEKGNGWAGQTSRDWRVLDPTAVATEAARLTKLNANPVKFEPGRFTAILARPAVAQLVRSMGIEFDARTPWDHGPLYDPAKHAPRMGQRIMDSRIGLSSDPNDPVAGYLPFDERGQPLRPATWVENGTLTDLAYIPSTAIWYGKYPPNFPPQSLRMTGGETTVDMMIENCTLGIYVNRFARVNTAPGSTISELVGVTEGGCFLVRHGKIEKAIQNLAFRESPWLAFNRIEAIGTTERTAFGFSPWLGSWPIAPTVVPPLKIRDFNFTALADAV